MLVEISDLRSILSDGSNSVYVGRLSESAGQLENDERPAPEKALSCAAAPQAS